MKDFEEKIYSAITAAGLPEEKKVLWQKFLGFFGKELEEGIADLIERDKRAIVFLTENLEEKMKLMETKDEKGWAELVEREKDFLNNLEG